MSPKTLITTVTVVACLVIIVLRAAERPLIASAQPQPAVTMPESRPATQPAQRDLDPLAQGLAAAHQAAKSGDPDTALSLYRRLCASYPGDPRPAGAACDHLVAMSQMAAKREDYPLSVSYANEAASILRKARAEFEAGAADASAIAAVSKLTAARLDAWAAELEPPVNALVWQKLSAADKTWKDGRHRLWFNNCDKMVEALRLLRDARDFLPFLNDDQVQNKYFEVLNCIRICVPEKEWPTIAARAGLTIEKNP